MFEIIPLSLAPGLPWLKQPARKVGDCGFETHSDFSMKKMFLLRSLGKIQYCGEALWPKGSVLDIRPSRLEFQIMCLRGQCHLIHLTILGRLSWPSVAYMCTKMVWKTLHLIYFFRTRFHDIITSLHDLVPNNKSRFFKGKEYAIIRIFIIAFTTQYDVRALKIHDNIECLRWRKNKMLRFSAFTSIIAEHVFFI